jgi:N-acyl-L-homoserine lactone synthetase
MLAAIQELRYEVYCLERNFIDPDRFPDKREVDEYDPASVHFAATDERGRMVGTLRLVLDSPLGFPIEAHVSSPVPGLKEMDRNRTAEISRLIVARTDRGFDRGDALRRHHRILLPLFRDMYRKSVALEIDYWLAAMEPGLHRLLEALMGLSFRPAGDSIEYYGSVVPYVAEVREMKRAMERRRPALFAYFQEVPPAPAELHATN